MVVVDSTGILSGLVMLWDYRWATLSTYQLFAGIFLMVHVCEVQGIIHFLNLYAPYKDISTF